MPTKQKGIKHINWWGILIFAALIGSFPLLSPSSYIITQATFIGIYAIVAIGLGLLMGFAGQISLGQAAFYGVGAYTTAILTATYGLNPWVGLLFSILIPALLAYVMGHTMSRLSGYYLAMATLALGIIVNVLLVEWREYTNGASGFYGIPPINLFGMNLMQGTSYFYFVWAIAVLVIIISMSIVHSRVGRALRSIHDSEIASSAMGVDTGKYKMQIFIYGAMLAGLAGWLFAHMSYSISPSSFTLDASILFLAMVVLGGATSIWGTIIGTALITVINIAVHTIGNNISFITSDFEHVLNGLILMLVVIFFPRGLFPSVRDWVGQKIANRKEKELANHPSKRLSS